MSRILSGKMRLEIAPVDLASVVEAALDTVRPAAEARGIRLQPALDSCGAVMGDASRLQQIAWNLLNNAIKFTPRGGRVQVLVQCLDSAVELTIADTGQGIPKDFQPHVFERFRQADGGINRARGGLGLGLSIVRQLVELHGGSASVFSEGEGRGASFTVRLPLSVTRRRETDPPLSPVPSAHPPPGELSGLHLLIVDDEEDTREMLAMVLEASGARVSQASSAAEGRRQLQAVRPDVLMSDIGMPGENGYSFIQSVRALPWEAGGNVPAIALTAYARSEDRTQALAAGFTAHVAKPVETRELSATITALARHVRSTRDG
jgi:CheY-like chemotaxis protein/two-component sensor histidine kinase